MCIISIHAKLYPPPKPTFTKKGAPGSQLTFNTCPQARTPTHPHSHTWIQTPRELFWQTKVRKRRTEDVLIDNRELRKNAITAIRNQMRL